MITIEFCEFCNDETIHHTVDAGYGWTEYGSHGTDHSRIVTECSDCGAIHE